MRIADLRIRNFRGIREAHIRLGDHTVLLGPNGSGKTAIIEALTLLFGRDRMVRTLTEHDFYGSAPAAADRIQIVATVYGFQTNDPADYPDWFRANRAIPKWLNRETGELSPMEGPPEALLACQIGVCARFDRRSLEVEMVRYFHDDNSVTDAFDEEARVSIPTKLIRDFGFFLVPANRSWDRVMSFSSELFRRVVASGGGTPAEAVLSERDRLRAPAFPLEADAQMRPLIESVNLELTRYFVAAPTLHLRITATDSEGVLDAVLAHYRYGPQGTQLPARRHGSGLVSLQWLLLLLQFGRQRAAAGESFWMALEEPELHVPPPLQRRLVRRIQALATQTLVSTHSPVVAAMAVPASLLLVRNEEGAVSATSLGQSAADAEAPNAVRKLFQLNRAETIGALMHDIVLVPEGRLDCEWLRLLVRAVDQTQSWTEETDCYFDSQVGVIPTNDAAVVATFRALAPLHSRVCCFVDGDEMGLRYATELQRLELIPRAVLRWPDGWAIEDFIGWVLMANQGRSIELMGATPTLRDCATVADLVVRLKSLNRQQRGLKGDTVAYESIAEIVAMEPACCDRARDTLNSITNALGGKPAAHFGDRDLQGILVFQP